jgi:hypothetical protein
VSRWACRLRGGSACDVRLRSWRTQRFRWLCRQFERAQDGGAPVATRGARQQSRGTRCDPRPGDGRRERRRTRGRTAATRGSPDRPTRHCQRNAWRYEGCRVAGYALRGARGSRPAVWSSRVQSRESEGCDAIIVVLLRLGASMPDTACHRHATLRASLPCGVLAHARGRHCAIRTGTAVIVACEHAGARPGPGGSTLEDTRHQHARRDRPGRSDPAGGRCDGRGRGHPRWPRLRRHDRRLGVDR